MSRKLVVKDELAKDLSIQYKGMITYSIDTGNYYLDGKIVGNESYEILKVKLGVPTKVSDLSNDSQFLAYETDPVFLASSASSISDFDILNWNSKTSNEGTITGVKMNNAVVGTSGVVDLGQVVTQHQDISGKANTGDAIGSIGLLFDPTTYRVTILGTKVDGTAFTGTSAFTFPQDNVVVSGTYDSDTNQITLILNGGLVINFPLTDLVHGLQNEITPSNKLSADLIEDGTVNKTVTQAEKNNWDSKGTYSKPSGGIPKTDLSDSVQASLNLANTALQSFTEVDPTVPSWAKQSTKPHYTASEVGALPANTYIPQYTSDLTNDSGYLTLHQDISGKVDYEDLDDVAFSGSYNDLTDTPAIPVIPTNVSYFTNDAGYITSHQDISDKVEYSELSQVAFSGSYSDLENKPTIPTVPTNVSAFNNDAGYLTQHQNLSDYATKAWVGQQGYITEHQSLSNYYTKTEVNIALEDKQDELISGTNIKTVNNESILGSGNITIATVATSGSYNDLTNKPDLSVYITENEADDKYAPYSELAGYATTDSVYSGLAQKQDKLVAGTGISINDLNHVISCNVDYDDLSNKPTIPTKVSDLTNDAGYTTNTGTITGITMNGASKGTSGIVDLGTVLTEHQDISGKADDSSVIHKTGNEVINGAKTLIADSQLKLQDSWNQIYNEDDDETLGSVLNSKLSITGTAKKTASIPYGVVDSTSTSTVFTATVPGITALEDGTCMMLRNSVVTSASGFTLNINGLGAHHAFNNMTLATADTTIFNINYTMLFVYCANVTVSNVQGAWCCYRGYDANTNTIGYQLRGNSATLPVSDTARYYKLYFTSADGSQWVPASINSTNNYTGARTPNQRPISPFGPIVYTSANTNYAIGANLAAATAWQQYTINLGYSFGPLGTGLTVNSPVYLKCAPQSDGSAIIDSTTPIVQALPSTEDGKIYIFLGIAYNATNIELNIAHPVYYYKDNAIRLWTNQVAGGGSITIDTDPTSGSSNAVSSGGVYTALATKANTSSLATVATSGSYNDLSDKPTIPTIPVNVSAFTNDAGYLTSHQDISDKANNSEVVHLTGNETIFGIKTISATGKLQVDDWNNIYNWDDDETLGAVLGSKERTSNKVTSLSSSSTDAQYPSAKCVYDLVGDIQTTLDAILGGTSLPTMISFHIQNRPYQAEDGMSWGEWIESEYNTDGFLVDNLYIYSSGWSQIEDDNGSSVKVSDLIINGELYWSD